MPIDWIGRIFVRMELLRLRNEVIGKDNMTRRCLRPSISNYWDGLGYDRVFKAEDSRESLILG